MRPSPAASMPSSVEHHETVKELFHRAVLLAPSDRVGFLRRTTGGDPGLLAELESLLCHFAEPDPLDRSAVEHSAGPRLVRSGVTPRFASGTLVAGRYQIERLIGRGGMSEVYAAHDRLADEKVALKTLTPASRDHRDRLREEARLARLVSHPAVCRVHDLGEQDGELFLTMELVEGPSLEQRLADEGRLDSRTVARLAGQICAGLAAAHRVGVLHRDLKPGNVLLDRDSAVRLTDFGIASSLRENDRGEDPRRALYGTPLYMAPEDLGASSPVTQQTDLYSLGVLLYELVTGKAPFDGGDLDTLSEQHRFAAPERPSRLAPDVDPELESLVLCLLRKRPEDRAPSASACEKAFSAIAARLSGPGDSSSPAGGVEAGARLTPLAFTTDASGRPSSRRAAPAANKRLLDSRWSGRAGVPTHFDRAPCQATARRIRAYCRGVAGQPEVGAAATTRGRWAVVTAACRFVDFWAECSELIASSGPPSRPCASELGHGSPAATPPRSVEPRRPRTARRGTPCVVQPASRTPRRKPP